MSTNPDPILFTGGCYCGGVTYTSTALPSHFTNCHCTTCRKLSGAPYLTFGEFPTTSITFQSSSSLKKKSYSDIAERMHCSECGSQISMQYHCEPEVISIAAGSIDEGSVKGKLPKVDQNIFVGQKAGWFELPEDGVRSTETFGSAFLKKIEDWEKALKSPGVG
ncbi:hypothetical protein LSUE1_G008303 [Lachnellula suecica]|uniref:CENP-V/GFA domain-containing protein n=1 Tax=Lachnellula suecica TaxID=602035 RepID=A0A8T9BUA5_9HELO|nr:hypothetical protein LSUE1_G008303 [Lachnellula suecica]